MVAGWLLGWAGRRAAWPVRCARDKRIITPLAYKLGTERLVPRHTDVTAQPKMIDRARENCNCSNRRRNQNNIVAVQQQPRVEKSCHEYVCDSEFYFSSCVGIFSEKWHVGIPSMSRESMSNLPNFVNKIYGVNSILTWCTISHLFNFIFCV